LSAGIRLNNNGQHISSAASSVEFDPTNAPAFDSSITNLQLLGNAIDVHATKPLVTSTESTAGVLQIATLADAIAGTSNTKAITPYTLQQKLNRPNATDAIYGLVRFATPTERNESNASVDIAINTAGVWDIIRNKTVATESTRGCATISTLTAAQAGVDDTTMMTPAKVKAAIDTFAITSIVTVPSATESSTGTVKISISPVVNASLHAGYAVSPKGFIETRANQTRVGTTRIATQAEADARTATDLALCPAALPIASDTKLGIVQLATQAGAGVTNKAITAHAATAFINRNGDTMTGNFTVGNIFTSLGQNSSSNALTRKDYVDGLIANKANSVHSHNTINEVQTILWQGNLDRGNFVLGDRWDNFDYLIIESTGDNNRWFNTHIITKIQIQNMQNNYSNYNLISSSYDYWYGKFLSDAKTFVPQTENCRLRRIIGVKRSVS